MGYTFNGTEKRIDLTAGTTTLDMRDAYSRWKDWVQTADNARFEFAFAVVGGEPVDSGQGIYVTSYFFLSNGWKIRPQETAHTLVVANGVLVTDDGSDPFIPTLGAYNVLVKFSQPVKSETVATAGAAIDFDDLLDGETLESGVTMRQALRLMLAALAGKVSGAAGTTVAFRNAVADSKDRIIATVDADGNRTAITYDAD